MIMKLKERSSKNNERKKNMKKQTHSNGKHLHSMISFCKSLLSLNPWVSGSSHLDPWEEKICQTAIDRTEKL